MAIVIIPNFIEMFNENITILKKIYSMLDTRYSKKGLPQRTRRTWMYFNHEGTKNIATESTEVFSQLGVLGKLYSQRKLCHRILPSTTRPTKWPFYKLAKGGGINHGFTSIFMVDNSHRG